MTIWSSWRHRAPESWSWRPGSPVLVRHIAGGRIWVAYEHLRAHEAVLGWADVPALHAIRIDAKRLRYTLESFREDPAARGGRDHRAGGRAPGPPGGAQRRRHRSAPGPGAPHDERAAPLGGVACRRRRLPGRPGVARGVAPPWHAGEVAADRRARDAGIWPSPRHERRRRRSSAAGGRIPRLGRTEVGTRQAYSGVRPRFTFGWGEDRRRVAARSGPALGSRCRCAIGRHSIRPRYRPQRPSSSSASPSAGHQPLAPDRGPGSPPMRARTRALQPRSGPSLLARRLG